jgi:hypothetical protein
MSIPIVVLPRLVPFGNVIYEKKFNVKFPEDMGQKV